jgi:hypothetical protein
MIFVLVFINKRECKMLHIFGITFFGVTPHWESVLFLCGGPQRRVSPQGARPRFEPGAYLMA